jgi:hypothetical protein
MRLPNPDLIKPAAMNIHIATIQAVELPNPVATSSIVNTPLSVATTIPISVTAIIGNGFVMQAMIVATKIANSRHATILIANGRNGVTNHKPIPNTNGKIKPFHFTVLNIAGPSWPTIFC